jgi:hypothetical protein
MALDADAAWPLKWEVSFLLIQAEPLRRLARAFVKRFLEFIVGWLITKYMITAAVVVLVSEVAKRSDKLGGFVAALPLVTFLALVWLYVEKQPEAKIANHAWYTFWYVVPTLPMFLVFPILLPRIGFWLTMLASLGVTVICFGLLALVVRHFGIELLP